MDRGAIVMYLEMAKSNLQGAWEDLEANSSKDQDDLRILAENVLLWQGNVNKLRNTLREFDLTHVPASDTVDA